MSFPLVVAIILLGFLILVARVEASSDKHAPWRIAVLGARRTFPLKWQAATLVVVLVGLAFVTAVLWHRGALPGP